MAEIATSAPTKQVDARGSCYCGGVTYELSGPPFNKLLCHCKGCRKASGSAFMANSHYNRSQFTLLSGQELLKEHVDPTTGSGHPVQRIFCGACGSPVYATSGNPAAAGMIAIMTGLLDAGPDSHERAEGGTWTPANEYFCSSRRAFVSPVEGAVQIGQQ